MSELEDEVRLLARIEVEAAKREVAWIAERLTRLAAERKRLDKREAELLAERTDAHARLKRGLDALGGKP